MTMPACVWIRLGDAGDYESFPVDWDCIASYLHEARIDPGDMVKRPVGFTVTGSFDGANYISLFYGDAPDQPERIGDLSFADFMEIVDRMIVLQNAPA